MNKRHLFFFIGTEAELIKVFPVILECKKERIPCHIIASGQNDITNSVILKKLDCGPVDLELSKEEEIKKSALGLVRWWVKTYSSASKRIRDIFSDVDFNKAFMIVHGDTVSTYMGARIGNSLGMKVCHIEAGLRSHNLFNPFPEEIDRLLTSRIARIHFAPGDEAEKNLNRAKGIVINTKQNSLLDSLKISESIEACEGITSILNNKKPYFVFVMHRQENLADEKLVRESIRSVLRISERVNAVVILHTITRNTYDKLGILKSLENNSNITLLSRVDYFSFMKLLNNSEFVITDGGSNQEELYYMGKPTLVMRKTTERSEGMGKNAVLYKNAESIVGFFDEYEKYRINVNVQENPSKTIVEELIHIN